MPSVSLAFFAIDHGTASTAASLIAPVDNRFRLLASAVVPRGVEVEAVLEDLVLRVAAVEPTLLGPAADWRRWARLESATREPRRVLCIATTSRVGDALSRMFAWRGWSIAGRVSASHIDPLAAMAMCLAPDIDAIAVAAGGRSDDEQRLRARLAPLLAAVLAERPGLPVLVCGPGDWPDLAGPTVIPLAAPDADPGLPDPALAGVLAAIERRATDGPRSAEQPGAGLPPEDIPSGRLALAEAIGTLATLLDRRVEAVDVGHAGGTRLLAGPTGLERQIVTADAALVPARIPDEPGADRGAMGLDAAVEDIAGWSAIRTDPFTLADRLRNLRLAPWRDVPGDGARLRLAALRAALARLDRSWHERPAGSPGPGDLVVCCGGAFAAVPPAAAALAVVDGMRAPGVRNLFHDHARLLGPIGALPDEGDRRRLLADLLDDALLPIGSTIVVGEGRVAGRAPIAMRLTSQLARQDVELPAGDVQVLDLPPGVLARVELAGRDPGLLGLRSRRVAVEVSGGLAGLLVDTRDVPLRLPDRAERRRAQLEAWEQSVWRAEP
ncbi:MAG: hypothetical protein U0667_15050 [Chloroflexota bacterium]